MKRVNLRSLHRLLPLIVLVIAALIRVRTEHAHAGLSFVLGATLLIALADLVSDVSPSVAAFMYVERLQMATAVFSVSLAMAVALAVSADYNIPASVLPLHNEVLVGLGVGLGTRKVFLASFQERWGTGPTYAVKLMLSATVGVIVLAFPSEIMGPAQVAYTLSVGIGFFVHYLKRRLQDHGVAVSQEEQPILATLNRRGTQPQSTVDTLAAVKLAQGDIRGVREILRRHDDDLTPGLALIKATLQRREGQQGLAIDTVHAVVNRPERVEEHSDALLYILESIASRELGREPQARCAIEKALRLSKGCFFANFINASSHIERLPLPGDPDFQTAAERREEAKRLLDIAIDGKARKPTLALAGVIAGALPLTPIVISSVIAELQLKRGDLSGAKIMLDGCMAHDTSSPDVFLTMGLFHTADAALSKGVGNFERGEQSAKRAEFCFRVARDIDNRTSRAKIRAQEILKSKGSGFLSPTRV